MRVRVRHGLPGVGAGVKDHPIPARGQTLSHRHPMRLRRHLVQQAISRRGDRGQVSEMNPRDDQDVYRRLGIDVTERNGAITI